MMNTHKARISWGILALLAVGAAVRVALLFSIPFDTPFHLGGLFYEFSRQILLNHFALPQTIPYYSLGGIPFAYPPLGFYIQAVVMKLFSPPQFVTVNLLPPLIAVCSLPAFYWSFKQQTDDNRLQAAALFAFALMPSAFVNQIEGAGLAEACGTVALLLYLGGLFRFERSPRLASTLWAGLFLGLCVLSSPGSAYASVILSLFFFIKLLVRDIKSRSFKNSAWLLLIGLTGLLVSAPYWLTILQHRELGGLTTTFLTQQDVSAFVNQIRYMITFKPADMVTFVGDEGVYGFLFDFLVFAGIIWSVLNKRIFQVLIFFALWLVPREGSWMVAIPAAWLAATGFVQVIWPLFQKAIKPAFASVRLPLAPGLLSLILVLLMAGGAILSLQSIKNQTVLNISAAQVQSLQQDGRAIPLGAHVLAAGSIALQEWSPALLEREVLNCEFGLEWQPDELAKASAINEALTADDLTTAMAVVRDYSGDASLWLVADPQQFARLAASAGPSLEISIQKQTPELVFAIVQTK
jgi:hypothetical protein